MLKSPAQALDRFLGNW